MSDPTHPFAAPSVMTHVAPPGIGSLLQVTLSLGLVLAVMFAIAWFARRMRGFAKTRGGALEIVAQLPLGQKERAVLIRCGTTQILLGVAQGNVNTLHVLAEPVSPTEEATANDQNDKAVAPASRQDFKSILKRSLGL